MNDKTTESVRAFYEDRGWKGDDVTEDASRWEDLRPCAAQYVSLCRRKVLDYLPKTGDRILDAASGPIQYPEYLDYSAGFNKRVCVDISQRALDIAKAKLGSRGEYHCASITELPLPDNSFDAVVSMHTIYHIDRMQQERAVRELIRVAKPGAPVVIVYANPWGLFAAPGRLAKWLMRKKQVIYFYAHPLSWWRRFGDVQIHLWRFIAARESKLLLHSNGAFAALATFEHCSPRLATSLGHYPLIVIRKH